MNVKTLNALPKAEIRYIEPMYARVVSELPEGKEWLYEVKFDGYRCLAGRDSTGATLWSRRGNLFTEQFPQIVRACERLPPGPLWTGRSSPSMKAGGARSIFCNITAQKLRRCSFMRSTC